MIIEPETVTLDDGSKMQVSAVIKTTYKYNVQGKISELREQLLAGDYRSTRYAYTPTTLLINVETFAYQISSKPYTTLDTIQLNEQSLISRYSGLGEPYLLYNTERQLIGTSYHPGKTHMYEAGNLTQVMENALWVEQNGQLVPTSYLLKQFTYNSTRPNLPVVEQFRGQPSRNLPTKEVWQVSDITGGPVYQKTFTYTYDKLGRVKRCVAHGKALNPGWLIEDDTYVVGVTDYEYECL